MNTYTWKVTALSTMPIPKPNYVISAIYEVMGTDGTHTVLVSRVSNFEINIEKQNYIPYEQLTEEIVLGWIQSEPNLVVNTQANLDGQIDSIVNPPVSPTNTPLPWSN